MGKTTHQIEGEIVEARNRLGRDLDALEHRIRQTVDWRVRFGRNPNAFLAAAFAAGFLIGLITVPSKRAA